MEKKTSGKHLIFNTSINRLKPRNIHHPEVECPFCDITKLENIIDRDQEIILLENKYPVLEKAYQLVLIETDQCHAQLPDYSTEHAVRLFQFAIQHWLGLALDSTYQSVIMFKNVGPLAGGSLVHPHMQIIGLEDVSYQEIINQADFIGLEIASTNHVALNISTQPRVGLYEFNIVLNKLEDIPTLAIFVQKIVHYISNVFSRSNTSYNLFFYQLDKQIIVKVIPRFITTPLYIGYGLQQVAHNIEDIAKEIKALYFQ